MSNIQTSTASETATTIDIGRRVITQEAEAVASLKQILDQNFTDIVETILACQGRVIVMGMGKSGHIGNKIAATLASTGTPAFFVHPAEACHGDLGMITDKDVILLLSNSGTTSEIVTLLPVLKRLGVPLIVMTCNGDSILARDADKTLVLPITCEACPHDLAPTTSTTASLVMGDVLAIALLEARGFTREDFGRTHPAGRLGKRLLLRVNNLMAKEEAIPTVCRNDTIIDALVEVTNKRLGMTIVLDEKQHIVGLFTDGDLRRALDNNIDVHKTTIGDVMTNNFKSIQSDMLASHALHLMEKNKITSLIVTDDGKTPTGVVHLHQLLAAGLM